MKTPLSRFAPYPPRGDDALTAGWPLLGVPGRGSAHCKGSIEWVDMGFLE